MKLCKDCEHFARSNALCTMAIDPVFGLSRKAAEIRTEEDECGKDAKWFAERKHNEEDWREPRDEDGYRKPE